MTQPLRAIQTEHLPAVNAHDRRSTVVLSVQLAGHNGERWDAIGIGCSHSEALDWALGERSRGRRLARSLVV